MDLIPAHSRFTRMYEVTNGIAFQAISNSRNINQYFFQQRIYRIFALQFPSLSIPVFVLIR